MRRNIIYKLFLGVVFCFFVSTETKAQSPTVSITGFEDTLLCVQGSFQVTLTTSAAFDTFSNVFQIYISDANGSFSNPTLVGQLNDFQSGTTTCTLPASITAAVGYRIRAVATSPSYTSSNNGKDIRVSAYPTFSMSSNSPVCVGGNINMTSSTSNPQPTFLWQGPNSFSSAITNPSISNSTFNDSGTYYLSVTSYKCTSTDSIEVIITPQPKIDSIQAPSAVCVDEELKITAFTNIPQFPCSTRITMPPPYTGNPCTSITIVKTNNTHAGKYFVESKIGSCVARDSVIITVKPLPDTPVASNNGPLCIGDTLKISGNSTTQGVTYWWSGPNGFIDSQQYSGINGIIKANEGDYKLYARKNGCNSKPGVTELEVGIPLVALEITGDTLYCPGDNLQLRCNASTLIGIEWIGPNGYTDFQRTTSISGVTADYTGYFSVTQEVLGCKSPPASVFVKVPDIKRPKPETNTPLCIGQEIDFTITGTTNGTYNWAGPNNFTSTDQNPSISNINKENEGYYYITTSLEHCTETDSALVIVKPQPEIADISSNTPVCSGTTLELNSQSSLDSSSYVWNGPNGYTSTDQNPRFLFSNNASGTYTVKTIRQGCESEVKSTEVETREGPGTTIATSNSPIEEGDNLMLYAKNNKDSVTFLWEGPDGFTSEEQNPQIIIATYRNSGEYKLTAAYNQCSVTVYTNVVVKDIFGIALELYPNPNTGKFTIEGITQSDQILNLAIFNHLGRVVYRGEVAPQHSKFKAEIDLTGVPSGVYLLQLNAGIEKRTERVTIIQQ